MSNARNRLNSPRTPFLKASKASNPTTRSKSTPSSISEKNADFTNPKSTLSRQSCTDIEGPCDFYLTEIQIRRFISPHVKKTLMDIIKTLKTIGSKFVLTRSKSKVAAKQFWTKWSEFQNIILQELQYQLTNVQTLLNKKLTALDEISGVINIENVHEETHGIVLRIQECLTQGRDDNLNALSNELRGLQSFVSSDDADYKQNAVKFQLTSTISQIISQMKNVKDIKYCFDNIQASIDIDNQTFESLIPYEVLTSASNKGSSLKTKESDKKITKIPKIGINDEIDENEEEIVEIIEPLLKHKSLKEMEEENPTSNVEKSNINENLIESHLKSEIEYEDEEVLNLMKENELLQKQIDEVQKRKVAKQNDLLIKKKKEEEELRDLKQKISHLNQKTKILMSQKLERNTHSCSSVNPLSCLRSDIREAEKEKIRLQALNDRLIGQIDQSLINNYEKNSTLRKTQYELYQQIFDMRIRCIQINKIVQKASTRTFDIKGGDNIIKSEFAQVLSANEELNERLISVTNELNKLKNSHNKALYEKYNSKLQKNSEIGLQSQLDKVKELYRSKKQELLEQQQKQQTESAARLRKKTENSLMALRSDTKSDIDEIRTQLEEVKNTYNNITNQYNIASSTDEEFVIYNGQKMSFEEAEEEIHQILAKFREINEKINSINADEARSEVALFQNEINEVTTGNQQLIEWISEIKKKSIEIQSKLQSLTVQYQIIGKKNEDPSFDIESAFNESNELAEKQNQVLQNLLDDSLSNLEKLGIETPF
ncbi:hypothetical protein TRFO_07010 [Tritrichomonas foetus]|uniref:Uncharacterized protein n=1 Tax=Tritrichomonas foetus TaxID=1144522 RepID=A0A1J4JTZ4_9EUKA|nr:hypothetical protein TRFO_07010 [Tritrichomonas foetus]|eukprot:OHT02601.1 hypothetical protein TRFO_07010 [Tritrichomonas foetus]